MNQEQAILREELEELRLQLQLLEEELQRRTVKTREEIRKLRRRISVAERVVLLDVGERAAAIRRHEEASG